MWLFQKKTKLNKTDKEKRKQMTIILFTIVLEDGYQHGKLIKIKATKQKLNQINNKNKELLFWKSKPK